MNLEPFHKILNKAMGLSPDSLGRTGVSHALGVRMRENGVDERAYLNLLRSSAEERDALVEEVVVPETWFFRDTKPFDLLFETAFNCKEREFKVLSAPCSTGEEAYSIAMTLMGAGFDPSHFVVDGVDISRCALDKARAGIYTENSFRSTLPGYVEGCFKKDSKGRKLSEKVRNSVNFYTGNILEGCLPNKKYDVIFCRNLLIYLDDKAKECLARMLNERLKKDGLLFVGHAEILPVFDDWFTPLRKSGVFALKKGERKVASLLKQDNCPRPACDLHKVGAVRPQFKSKLDLQTVFKKRESNAAVTAFSMNKVTDKKSDTAQSCVLSVKDVKSLADLGRTAEALKMCNYLLEEKGPESELYHLCGLLHESQGDISMAEECYGKSLYLDSDHVESMVHLALLLDNRGEKRKAELLRNRVRRAEKR